MARSINKPAAASRQNPVAPSAVRAPPELRSAGAAEHLPGVVLAIFDSEAVPTSGATGHVSGSCGSKGMESRDLLHLRVPPRRLHVDPDDLAEQGLRCLHAAGGREDRKASGGD